MGSISDQSINNYMGSIGDQAVNNYMNSSSDQAVNDYKGSIYNQVHNGSSFMGSCRDQADNQYRNISSSTGTRSYKVTKTFTTGSINNMGKRPQIFSISSIQQFHRWFMHLIFFLFQDTSVQQ